MHLNVLLWAHRYLLCPFPFLHILPVGWWHTAEDTPPLTNPIVCPCHSLGLRLYLCWSTGMLLQDIYKLLAVVLVTVFVSSSFVCVLCPLQASLPPAGPACTFSPLVVCFSGRVAEGHQDGALRGQFPSGRLHLSGPVGPDRSPHSQYLSYLKAH